MSEIVSGHSPYIDTYTNHFTIIRYNYIQIRDKPLTCFRLPRQLYGGYSTKKKYISG